MIDDIEMMKNVTATAAESALNEPLLGSKE